ncbi:MAG: ABC transporter substrate-binding protein [Actinomycetota bacterium]
MVGSVALAALALASACSNASSSTPTTTVPAANTTTRPDDGVLRIGVIAPRGGSVGALGTSTRDGVELAVRDINQHGGVNGHGVTTIVRDEGDNPATAGLAVQDLVQLGVDVIVGPTSSLNMLGTLKTAVADGVLTCSPTASALALDSFPDNGLLVRTIPSDSLEAQAMAHLVEQSGSSRAAIVSLDDPYGRPFAHAVQRGLQADGTTVTAALTFDGSEPSIKKVVTTLSTQHPDIIVVVADNATGPAIISAIDAGIPNNKPMYVVNDAQRRPATGSPSFAGALAARVEGVSPVAYSHDTDFVRLLHNLDPTATGLYAMNAYDCVNIIALAAVATGSSSARLLVPAIPSVTSNGTTCVRFSECAVELAADHNIDYNGPGGSLSIDSSGAVSSAVFDIFGFNEAGRDLNTGTITIGAG